MTTRAAGLGVTTFIATVVLAAPAHAAPATCTFDAATGLVTAQLAGSPAVVEAAAGGAIQVDGVACSGATTTSTDRIRIAGTFQSEVVTLRGAFAPGRPR